MIGYSKTTDEIWEIAKSLPEYEVSNLGRCRRIETIGVMPNGGFRIYGGVPWTGVWHPDEDRFILTYKGKNYKVARLVCEAFHGPPPDDKPVCMHIDEDSRNNRADNLKWGTQKENLNCEGFKSRQIFRSKRHEKREIKSAVERVLAGEITAKVAKELAMAPCTLSNHKRKYLASLVGGDAG